ncbi:S8 family peptidase [Rheinheimera sp. MMS21-TC3]|uniref:S8 family peptidase n=1 Tax=Rheinheimera sp. MMS21-TC3 TaxID=3072790 RepID=UPI0028C48484|nr:S8 family peptidase [Rheinheimera sp. MMS21-TC3]WNO60234.1 S8 family peptidase [Rheinheimera sp. MMS21-TC3]
MKPISFKRTALAALCLPAVLLSTQAFANDLSFASDGPPTRFIIKYKEAPNEGIMQALPQAMSQKLQKQSMTEKAQRFSSFSGESLHYVRQLNLEKHALFSAERRLSARDTKRMMELLAQDDSIEMIEEDILMQATATPNDPSYNDQWHYYESVGGLRAPGAWDNASGSGVVVAVLDTGYRPHIDLNANILPGYDMVSDSFMGNDGNGRDSDARDPGDWLNPGECGNGNPSQFRGSSWHGTHVAGTIAAVSNNNRGVAGVAYNAKIVPVRVLGKCGGYTSDIADGIIWASGGTVSGVPSNPNPADVINMSLGGGGSCSSTTQNAINIARNNGSVIIVAAGNDNTNANNFNPGSCPGVVNVAATGRNGGRAYYSNYGTSVDVAAPGGAMGSNADGVLSTHNTGSTTPSSDSYSSMQGTSMAAPHVAGVAALIKQVKPSATPDQIEQILKSTARSFPASCSGCGTGIVDANAAVLNAMGSGGGTPPPPTGGSVLQKAVAKTNISGASGSNTFYTFTVPQGATDLTFNMSGGTGDADLYVKFGSAPTSSSYDCRPYRTGNNESCSFPTTQAGTYHVMISSYRAHSGVSLVADYTPVTGGGNTGGSARLDNLSANSGDWLHYTLNVPAGMRTLNITTSSGTGDGDLYVRRGSRPTTTSYDCRPYRTGNNESCSFTNPQADVWHISIRSYRTFSGVTLNAEYNP